MSSVRDLPAAPGAPGCGAGAAAHPGNPSSAPAQPGRQPRRQEKELGSGCRDWDWSTHVGQEVGCWVWRAAGRSWARLGEAGCPGARAVPAHPGCSITARPSQTRRARHGPSPGIHTEQSPSSLPLRELREPGGTPPAPSPALPWQGKGRAGSAAPQHRRQLHAGCPSAVIWSSDIRAGTQPRSLSAQTPKQLSQLPSLVVFPCNVSPGSLPMTSVLHIPSPGRAEGTAGTPRISRAHYTHSLITARAAGDLPGLEGCAEGVEGKKFPWLCCVFPAEQGEPRYHMADINIPQLRRVPAPGTRGGAALPRRGRRGLCQSLLPQT